MKLTIVEKNLLSWTAMHIDFGMCKNSTRLTKIKRQLYQKETIHAEHGRIIKPNFNLKNPRRYSTIIYLKNRFRLCLRTKEVIGRN